MSFLYSVLNLDMQQTRLLDSGKYSIGY